MHRERMKSLSLVKPQTKQTNKQTHKHTNSFC